MRSLLPLTLYCISLVSLQELQALPAQERPDSHRSQLLTRLMNQKQDKVLPPSSQPTTVELSSAASASLEWLSALLRRPPASGMLKASSTGMASLAKASQMTGTALRVRRHAHPRGGHHHSHHGQLMRVGCVLGTCQVQNLSHRLYQLIGQNGRQDSSPINPNSPHSYG